ncbi:cell division protein [Zhengella mangrovi]|uniref:Cell division protein n=1 Tax=Zhengella mangrovi TaxID=1982044 RepID=A0A2G1QPX2_9HYPH|nr:penicillin-binding protein 2 [Zhengella mangrovi]PHP67597.1 cell division protein [Zhengella mangrovi]
MIRPLLSRKPAASQDTETGIVVQGARKFSGGRARQRVLMTMSVFLGIYAVIGGRLAMLAMEQPREGGPSIAHQQASRPDIVDRNGQVMATDITTASLYAEPRNIVDADEAIEQLATVLPDLDYEQTYRRLKSDAGFVWLKRELTPAQKARIHQLGIPGIGFRAEKRRFYPGGPTAAHILGLVNIDNQGIAGMEKYIDSQGLADLRNAGLATADDLAPFKLSIDERVQHIVRDELEDAMARFKAIAAGAVVLDVHTGEIVAMASLPDFNPNNPFNANDKDRLNRMSAGVYEMGSTFKAFTTAMALDSGQVSIHDHFDASRPIRIARFTIHDFHGKHRALSVPEIFIYSSNIGTAKMAEKIGVDGHREFLKRIGLLDRVQLELPEVATPTEPKVWKQLNSITISFGHGMATTPLQTAVAAAALLNGGKLIEPTLLPRTREEADAIAKTVVSERTSREMRYLFRLNVEKGSGKRAAVPGYFVGGKTGTAEKVVNGRYSSSKRFNAFLSGFPIYDPQYVVLVIIDEPKPEHPGVGATAGMNAAPTVGNIIRRSAALLGVKPEFGHESGALLASYR